MLVRIQQQDEMFKVERKIKLNYRLCHNGNDNKLAKIWFDCWEFLRKNRVHTQMIRTTVSSVYHARDYKDNDDDI